MSSELFENYSQDYAQIASSIRAKLADGGEAKVTTGEARKACLRRINMELEEADEIVAQMEIELASVPKDARAKKQAQVRGWKSELGRWKADSKSLMASSDRDELFSRPGRHTAISMPGSPPPGSDVSTGEDTDQRTRLLRGTQLLSDGQRRLEDSERIALETEDVGAGVLRNLRSQREQIEGTRDTLGRADGSIDKASGTLKQMIRRMYQQRVVTVLIIIVLIVLIIVVLWSKLS